MKILARYTPQHASRHGATPSTEDDLRRIRTYWFSVRARLGRRLRRSRCRYRENTRRRLSQRLHAELQQIESRLRKELDTYLAHLNSIITEEAHQVIQEILCERLRDSSSLRERLLEVSTQCQGSKALSIRMSPESFSFLRPLLQGETTHGLPPATTDPQLQIGDLIFEFPEGRVEYLLRDEIRTEMREERQRACPQC